MMLPISRWLFARHEWLKLEIMQFTDIGDNWLPGLFDFAINLTYEGEIHAGRAQAFDKNLAIEKASAEALERLGLCIARKNNLAVKNSSGFAAHRTRAQAVLGAMRELIERDVLMCAMLSGATFREIGPSELRATNPKWPRLVNRLARKGVELKIGELRSDFKERVFLCGGFGRDHQPRFGCSIGLGVSARPEPAIEKSIQECLMMMSHFLAGHRTRSRTLANFLKIKKPGFEHHSQLGLDLRYAEEFRRRFEIFSASPRLMAINHGLYESFTIQTVKLPKDFSSCPINIVHASQPDLQGIILGSPSKRNVNQARLRAYKKNLFKTDRLEGFDVLHVLG